MEVKQVFGGVFRIDGKIATLNLARGTRVYDEELVAEQGREYRMWNPYRSKLAAAIINGLRGMHIEEGSRVLYLGAATGTTASHVSDMVGKDGVVYCVEISERNMRELMKVCEARPNMLPILHDARDSEGYAGDVGVCDILYQDISAEDQAKILIGNKGLLKRNGFAYVAIKSQSIDVTRKPALVYKEFLEALAPHFEVLERIDIAPFSKMHLFVLLQKK